MFITKDSYPEFRLVRCEITAVYGYGATLAVAEAVTNAIEHAGFCEYFLLDGTAIIVGCGPGVRMIVRLARC